MSKKDFFKEFPEVSKADWLAKIQKDLKGRQLEDLQWHLNERIVADPFAHADDFLEVSKTLTIQPNNWKINEKIKVADAAAGNSQALEALNFGADSLTFEFENTPSAADFFKILEGVFIEMISLNFCGAAVQHNPGYFFGLLEAECAKRNLYKMQLHGSVAFDPAAANPKFNDWRYLLDLLDFSEQNFPNFQILTIGGTVDFQSPENADSELAAILKRGNFYFEKLVERGASAEKIAARMGFEIAVGKSYFVEIAKLRAFKLLWFNALQAWGVPTDLPKIHVSFAEKAYSDSLYSNMIAATTMAMSAVAGGTDVLTVLPYDAGRESQAAYPQSFSRRIARNVQHLLKSESGFAELADPAAGSFYIEKLTRQLADSAWQLFQN